MSPPVRETEGAQKSCLYPVLWAFLLGLRVFALVNCDCEGKSFYEF